MANQQQEPTKVQIEEFDVDAFRQQAVSTFEKYKNIVYGALLLLVIVVGGLWAYFYMYKGPREKKAEEEIFRAEYLVSIDSFKLALDGRNLPGQQGNFMGLLDFIKEYGGTAAGSRAYFLAGASLLHLGKFEDANTYLKSYSGGDPLMQAQVYGMLGDVKSELNDVDAAYKYYLQAADHYPNEATSPIHLRKAALLLADLKKNNAEAVKLLERLRKDYPKAAQVLAIDKDIVRLGGK